eukprot:SAG31_NODE_16925_length_690_cov_0.945854_2_plen_51_part_00
MQNRITDHRIGLTTHGIDSMLSGGPTFWEIANELKDQDVRNKIEALADDM